MNIQLAEKIVQQAEERGVNLCSTFDAWTKIAFALADLGEAGRPLFHRLARMDKKYREQENDKKFSNALATADRIKFPTLVYMAKQADLLADIDITAPTATPSTPRFVEIAVPKHLCTLPTSLVEASKSYKHNLAFFLMKLPDAYQAAAKAALDMYYIGATGDRQTIFWQIDTKLRVRTGKVMQYDPETGHRTNRVDWVHSTLKRHGTLPPDWELTQCLFGEHLLMQRPAAPVALVESEKTAVLCSAVWPKYIWLSTGGCCNLRETTATVLAGRNVIVFPDVGKCNEWGRRVESYSFANFAVSDVLEDKGFPPNTDIADVLTDSPEQIWSKK